MSHAETSAAPLGIGLLGGSFDPPHLAHVMLALYGLSVGNLARVIVVPTFVHAFGKPLLPFEHRLRMCELAFEHVVPVEVSDLERELGGVSRTVRTLAALAQRYPGQPLRLLVGSDILGQRDRWQNFEEIEQRAPLLVAARARDRHASAGALLPPISSTELRAALAVGGDTAGLLPARVRAYIDQHGLYRGGSCA